MRSLETEKYFSLVYFLFLFQLSFSRGSSVSRSIPTPSPPSFEDREAEWKKMVKPCSIKLVKFNNLSNKKSTATYGKFLTASQV